MSSVRAVATDAPTTIRPVSAGFMACPQEVIGAKGGGAFWYRHDLSADVSLRGRAEVCLHWGSRGEAAEHCYLRDGEGVEMLCQWGHGKGVVEAPSPAPSIAPCPECGGCGLLHCCEGLAEQPDDLPPAPSA